MTARCVMVVGTSSGAGKSFLVTALCRWYARLGLRVAPFKAQNMSNNARVVAGGEIGSAQFFQALAARSVPDVRMNPLLLKPERDTRSQVVLLGQVSAFLTEMPWHQRSAHVWPQVCAALDSLRADHDVVVIEGAGSPAEINLQHSDIVNLRVAEHAAARCVLVTDIDRGGAFAHLYGTWMLLPPAQRRLLHGFVLNKFRGDARLLAPAPADLQELTGVPTVATLPMWRHHGLPEEDGVFDDSPSVLVTSADGVKAPITIAVVAYPRISNLDEFQVLRNLPGVRLLWARTATSLAGLSASDWIILPGSKQTSGDLAWLRASSMDAAITAHARRGGPVLGICGGLQMLGEAIVDPLGVEASPDDPLAGNAPGLGLLPLVTRFDPDKTVRNGRWLLSRLEDLPAPWSALAGAQVQGYEIHNGQTVRHAGLAAPIDVVPGLAWCNAAGNVLGLYLHGLFENADVLRRLFGHTTPTLETVFDGLADYVDRHFEAGFLRGLIE